METLFEELQNKNFFGARVKLDSNWNHDMKSRVGMLLKYLGYARNDNKRSVKVNDKWRTVYDVEYLAQQETEAKIESMNKKIALDKALFDELDSI